MNGLRPMIAKNIRSATFNSGSVFSPATKVLKESTDYRPASNLYPLQIIQGDDDGACPLFLALPETIILLSSLIST